MNIVKGMMIGFGLGCTLLAHAQVPTARLATADWPPYVAKNLPEHGFTYVIVKRAFAKAGYKTQINFYSWDDVIQLAKYKNDAFFPVYEKASTLKDVICSTPTYGGPIGLYKRKDSPIKYTVAEPYKNQAKAFTALQQYRFGVVKGYSNTDEFDTANYLTKIAAHSDYDNLAQLANHKVDLVMIDIDTAGYLISKNRKKFGNLEFMGPALSNKKLYVCFSTRVPGYEKKLADFNRSLQQIERSGEANKIRDRLDDF